MGWAHKLEITMGHLFWIIFSHNDGIMELQCHSETLSNYDPPPLLRRPSSVNEDKRRRPLKAICAPTNSSTQMNGEISTSGWQPGRHLGIILAD